jgi:hypothetical protein
MSDPSLERIVVNHLNQPVELYLVGGLVVLPPRGRLSIAESDRAGPQFQALLAARIIGLLDLAQPAAEQEATTDATEASAEDTGDVVRKGKRGNR